MVIWASLLRNDIGIRNRTDEELGDGMGAIAWSYIISTMM